MNEKELYFQRIKDREIEDLKINMFRWYEFKNADAILLVGKFSNIIISYFEERCVKVEKTSSGLYDLDGKYDCIIIMNYFDESMSDDEIKHSIKSFDTMLSEHGKIFSVFHNKYGIDNFYNKKLSGFSHKRINRLISDYLDTYNCKQYVCLPNVNQINILSAIGYNLSPDDIRRNINFLDYKTDLGLYENLFFSDVLKDGSDKIDDFCNDFLIVISKDNITEMPNAVYYNNIRPREYRLITKIYDDVAIKSVADYRAFDHMNRIKGNIEILNRLGIKTLDIAVEEGIISKISSAERLDILIRSNINNKEIVRKYIDFYKAELNKMCSEKSDINAFDTYNIKIDNQLKDKLHYTKYGLWDFTFQNIFIEKEESLAVYDQEWIHEGIPVEFILYRSVQLLESVSEEDKKQLLIENDIDDFADCFLQLEIAIQKELTDLTMHRLYENARQDKHAEMQFYKDFIKSKNLRIASLKQENKNEIEACINEYNARIHQLEENYRQLDLQLKLQINSRAFKFGKFFRKIFKPLIFILKKIFRIFCRMVGALFKLFIKAFPRKYRVKLYKKSRYDRRWSKLLAQDYIYNYNKDELLYSRKEKKNYPVAGQFVISKSIGIHLHLYYVDLMDEFYDYLSNIPYTFDLYVSTCKGADTNVIRRRFCEIDNLFYCEVVESENCGRDYGPMFVLFADKLKQYDYVIHIHSKKSLRYGDEQSDWRKYLLNNLLGSVERVLNNFYVMENYNVGIVYPDAHILVPYWSYMWLNESAHARDIYNRLGMEFVDEYLHFSAGSMFCAKKDAIKPLLDLNLTWQDFGLDTGQTGGTLEYVFEKIPTTVVTNQGFNFAVYNEEEGRYLLNDAKRNLNQYFELNALNSIETLKNYYVVSFDIFDTLITRKIFSPDDAFELINQRIKNRGIVVENYFEARKKAEFLVRKKKGFVGDCTIDEIYDEFIEVTGVSKEDSYAIKDLEIKTELDLCVPRYDSLYIFNELLRLNKKIVLISDMYLTKDIIERILDNCGYNRYSEIYISSDMGMRKDTGEIWKWYFDRTLDGSTIHVGDNEESDIHKLVELGKPCFYLMQGKKQYLLSDYAYKSKLNLDESILMGLIVNRSLFNSPFAMHNIENSAIVKNERMYGYAIIAPIVLKFFVWLIKEVRNNENEVLLFAAREGYYLQKIYNLILDKIDDDSLNEIEQHYFYVSRRAITVANIKEKEDIYELMSIPFKGTLYELFYYRLGMDTIDSPDRMIDLPNDIEIVKKIIDDNYVEIASRAAYERSNYLEYINDSIKDIKNKQLEFVDLGYSGTAQYYLSKLINQKVKGKYFVVSGYIKPLELDCEVDACYSKDITSVKEAQDNPFYMYAMVLEAFLTAPHGQLRYFRKDPYGKIEPMFNSEDNAHREEQLNQIYLGVVDFINEYSELLPHSLAEIDVDNELLASIYKGFIREIPKTSKDMEKLFIVEDFYCENGLFDGKESFNDEKV